MRYLCLIVLFSVIDGNVIEEIETQYDDRYLVNTSGCIILNTTLFPRGFKSGAIPPIDLMGKRVVRQISNFKFEVNTTYAKCCCRNVYTLRRWSSMYIKDNNLIYFAPICHPVNKSIINVEADLVRFECILKQRTKYPMQEYLFTNINKSYVAEKLETQSVNNETKISVLILGLASITRQNFHRFMPKTRKFLQNLDALEFFGFTNIGKDALTNYLGLLLRVNDSELRHLTCKKEGYFDKCPLIWKQFNSLNYVTGFAEDEEGPLTKDDRKGFKEDVLDYEYRIPDHHNSEDAFERNRLLFQYIRLFTIGNFKDTPYFFYTWSKGLTEWSLKGPKMADLLYHKLFTDLNKSHALDNTAIFFLSDHGYRGKTEFARYEKNLPMLFIILPKWFQEKYPISWQNIRENRYRLTTIRDVQTTIRDLLHLDKLDNKTSKVSEKHTRVSLFNQISQNRSCSTAKISPQLCTCRKIEEENTEYF